MATTAGPASGTAELILGAGTGSVGVPLEVQVPNGLPSLEPSRAAYVDPQASTYITNANSTTAVAGAVNTTLLPAGAPGLTIKFAIPA
jgi:hypothetical protein